MANLFFKNLFGRVKSAEKMEKDEERLAQWKMTFGDEFDKEKLDKKKWQTTLYWGEKLFKDNYTLHGNKQCYTKGGNLRITDHILNIVTKKEATEGKIWNRKYGFLSQQFQYTSGLVTTANLFTQQYGLFEAKIKIDSSSPAYHAFWLKSINTAEEIDVFRFSRSERRKYQTLSYLNEGVEAKPGRTRGINFSNKYYIYGIEWTPKKLVWRLNNQIVATQTNNVPNEPMCLVLNSGLLKEPSHMENEPVMQVDWVKCYQRK